MQDFRLHVIASINLPSIALCDTLKTEGIRAIAKTFVGNTDRVVSAARFPARLMNIAHHFSHVWGKAKHRIFGDNAYSIKGEKFIEAIPRMAEECKRIADEEIQRFDEPRPPADFSPEWLKILDGYPSGEQERFEGLLVYLEVLTLCTGEFLSKGVESMLSSMIVGMWTAFETLAGDLWVMAVNAQPQYLAALTGNSSRIENRAGLPAASEKASEPDQGEQEEDANDEPPWDAPGDKKVALGLMCRLTRGDYNLSGRMGDLLVEAERVKFISIKGIREAYSLAFSEKVRKARSDRIDAALAYKSLDALSAVRNLIVHKAGKADAVYIEDCKSAPTAPLLKLGEELSLDGETCRCLIEPVISASVELVKSVDSWLTLTRR